MSAPRGVQIVSELADRSWLMTDSFEASSRSAIKRFHSSSPFPSFPGTTSISAFQQLSDEIKRNILKLLKENGASHRQLERLTGVGRGLIQKL